MNIEVLHDLPLSPNLAANDLNTVCDFPSSTILDGGHIVVIYRRGTAKHSHDGIFVIQSSSDRGRSWTEPRIAFDGRSFDPPHTAVTGGMCQARDGTLVFSFFTVEGLQRGVEMFGEVGFKLPRRIFTAWSDDGGATWSEPTPYRYPNMPLSAITEKPFVLPDGEICMPIEYYSSDLVCRTAMAFSGDHGRAFSIPPVHIIGDLTNQVNFGDARFSVLPDGRILTLLWTFLQASGETIEVHRAHSSDWGRTWTDPESIGFVGQVTNPLSLPTGEVIAVSNYRLPPEGIRLWHSFDGGITWDTDHPLQMWDAGEGRILGQSITQVTARSQSEDVWASLAGFGFGTPDLVYLDDETILMSYYAAINDIIHVRACRFRLLKDDEQPR